MLKIAVIFGTRPEVIKLAPVIKKIKKFPHKFKLLTIATGQHEELLYCYLDFFSIRADYNLKIIQSNQSPFQVIKKLLPRLEIILKQEKPDLVLVQGDTSTAFASSLCAFYLSIPVAHIEAGLRTYDKYAPFPEEINRRLIDALSQIHFAPTTLAKNNLLREGILRKNIFVVGNTGIDTLLDTLKSIRYKSPSAIFKNIDFQKRIFVITVHRRENFGRPLDNICKAIKSLIKSEKEIEIIFVVHPNPNIKKKVYSSLNKIERIHLIKPLDYKDFVYLMKKSYLILTDSGGIQEEAAYLKKPVLVLRDKTERPEIVKIGVGKVIGVRKATILKIVKKLLRDKEEYQKMIISLKPYVKPYGNGRASDKIVKILLKYNKEYKKDKKG